MRSNAPRMTIYRVRTIDQLKELWPTQAGAKAERVRAGRPLSARSLTKFITRLGTVFRFAEK